MADRIITGPSIEKSIAPLRSFVANRCSTADCFWPMCANHKSAKCLIFCPR
jgi:hypothetical protein